jgi:glycosyltransferase involved in cell wall biosynthesis
MKVCYWGTYDAAYPRNRTLIDGLRKNGVEVAELNEQLWKSTGDKLARASAWWKDPGFLLRWVTAYFRLAFRLLREKDVDVVIVGYTGHFDMFVAKPLSLLKGVPVLFDTFLSLYEAFVEDRAVIKPGSLKARLLYLADKYSCALADMALLDTEEHIKYFCSSFGLPASKFRRSFVGANEDRYGAVQTPRPSGPFTVLHFGTYIPLHGIPHVLRAAKELEGEPGINFKLVGGGKEYAPSVALARELGLKNVQFSDFRDMPALLEDIAGAAVCLGIFGESPKALRVIPNKVFLSLAMGRPVITGDSPAARELLEDGKNCLLCRMADPHSLAEAILRLKTAPPLALEISRLGYETFRNSASTAALGKELAALLSEISPTRTRS